MERLYTRLQALSDRSNRHACAVCPGHRISRAYELASWVFLLMAVVLWIGFALAALGFFLGAMVLRREGL